MASKEVKPFLHYSNFAILPFGESHKNNIESNRRIFLNYNNKTFAVAGNSPCEIFVTLPKLKTHDMYPEEMVNPMRAELSEAGFEDLYTAGSVENAICKKGTTLLVINSVCGCAARNARPGAKMSLDGSKKPDQMVAVFAGVDKDAVDKAREFMLPFPPSSPCMALFKDGELVHMLERHHIEGRPAELIAENLQNAYNEYC